MCDHCGCSPTTHEHDHDHPHEHTEVRSVDVRESVLSLNSRLAERNRGFFLGRHIVAINMLSGPGAGKTTLIEHTVSECPELGIGVVVGDLETENDAERIRACGAEAVQITTGEVCHLDAHMVQHAIEKLTLEHIRILIIENVGNLVCPASFDLGERARVVLMSVTEGEDKPLKYPVIFHNADLVLVTKVDLADAVEFNRERAMANIRKVAPGSSILEISSKSGQGIRDWYEWIKQLSPATAHAH